MSKKTDGNIITFPTEKRKKFDVKINVSMLEVIAAVVQIKFLSHADPFYKKISTELMGEGPILSSVNDEDEEEFFRLREDKKDHVLSVFVRYGLIKISDINDSFENVGGDDASYV